MPIWNNRRLAAARRSLRGLRQKLALTYDSTNMNDGAGAQLQRIYGTYAISRLLGVTYVHSPLTRVDYQGLSALEAGVADPAFHHEFNDLFHVRSDDFPTDGHHTIGLPDISLDTLRQLVALLKGPRGRERPTLVKLALPYGIADRFPDCYEACKEISPFASSIREGRGLRVAVHVRRGDLFVVDSHRMLPNAYYIDVAQKVVRELEARGMDYQIELFTEVPHSALTVLPGHHGIATRIQAPVVVTPEMSRLGDFDVLPNLVRHVNGPAIDCIRKLATADVLVMSRSSLSYLAGILNRRGIVLYRPFWHRAPSSWVTVDRDGEFGQATFRKALKRH